MENGNLIVNTEKIAYKDVTYIRNEYKKNPTIETMKLLAIEYDVSIGTIQKYLGKLADNKRLNDKKLIKEANERKKEKTIEKNKEHKRKKNEGRWELPTIVTKSVELKPTKTQADMLYECFKVYRNLANFVKEGEARIKETKQPYEYVKKFRGNNNKYNSHWLGSCVNVITNTILPTAIRGINLERISFPVCGKQTGRNTSTDIDVKKINNKYYLIFNKEKIEILYQNHDDYYSKNIEKPLHELWESNIVCGGWILQTKKGKWYVKFGIHRKPSTFKWDENSKKIYMVIQPFVNITGITWNVRFFNEDNNVMYKMCLLKGISSMRILSSNRDYRTPIIHKAIKKLFRVWYTKFNNYRPVVILQDTIQNYKGNMNLINMNPTYKLQMKLKDKLASCNGIGMNVSGIKPFDIIELRKLLCV